MRDEPTTGTPDAARAELEKLFTTATDLHRRGHLAQAELLYETVLKVDPGHAGALHLLGVAAQQRGQFERAAELIGRAIAVDPGVAQYHFNRGVALQTLGRLADAAGAYREAVRLEPDYGEAYENLGVALQDSGDLEGARRAYERALAHDPGAPIAHQNLGTLLLGLGEIDAAARHFRAVLRRDPASGEAHNKLASTLLASCRYGDGWEEHEWRFHSPSFVEHNPPRVVPFPKWDGSPLTGTTILIHAEQGIGDEIMFASCYADVIARARRTLIECDPRLVALFTRSFPDAEVIAGAKNADCSWSAALGDVDWRIPAGSLPRWFRRTRDDFSRGAKPYLRADADAVARWRAVLDATPGRLNVGISWRGGKDPRSRNARSIPLDEWQPLFAVPGVRLIDLQYGDHAAEIDAFHARACGTLDSLEGADALRDPDGFIALIAALDLVISIDNSTVFMAGAVGTPVWVLLPSVAEWRWYGDDRQSAWYPSARLFRQREPGLPAWRAVLRDVAGELAAVAASAPAPRAVPVARPPAPRRNGGPASSGTAGRALLVNDTSSWYHWGCSCTSLAIHAALRQRHERIDSVPIHRIHNLAELPQSIDAFDDDACFDRFAAAHPDVVAKLRDTDVVYVNGEGSLHGLGPQAVGLLYLAHVAKTRYGRPVRLINHSCFPNDSGDSSDTVALRLYTKVYRELDRVAVREGRSHELVRAMGVDAVLAFDCLPLFVRRHGAALRPSGRAADPKRIVIAGSVAWGATDRVAAVGRFVRRLHDAGYEPIVLIGANAFLAADDRRFAALLQRYAEGAFRLVHATSELDWLRVIADAALLVSGRFHHSIAAAFLDTPFIVMESNTPKIAGLLEMVGVESFVSIAGQDPAEELLERARELAGADAFVAEATKERLLALAELNFAA